MDKPQILGFIPALEFLEHRDIHPSNLWCKCYSEIINSLQSQMALDIRSAERLIDICQKDLNEDSQCTSAAMSAISLVLKKMKEGKFKTTTILNEKILVTAKNILFLIKSVKKKNLLKKMGINTLLLLPDQVLKNLVANSSEDFLELVDFKSTVDFQFEITEKIVSIVRRVLKILDEDSKTLFLSKGLKAWFNSIIPGVIYAADENPESLKGNIDSLELLVENIIKLDYEEFEYWQHILRDTCDPKRYPETLKKLVEGQNECWHRLWMVFIRLLKDQITKVNKSGVSPINALLPVVELAFKLDPDSRCRAFECWNTLIDNFSTERNEALLNKRLKLLIIPLKLNNAKVPQTVQAKFKTWWHLIRSFHSKIDKYTETVLIPFLHFCFGKTGAGSKTIPTPGLLTEELKKQCVEALVEIIGHVDCNGCDTLPRLQNRLISTKLLVDHWNEWMNALRVAIESLAVNCTEKDIQKTKCIWKGFVSTIAELPANQIRADLVTELLIAVASLGEEIETKPNLADIVFDVMICTLFDNYQNIKLLMKTKSDSGPIYLLLKILFNTHLTTCFIKKSPEELIAKLKQITNFVMDPSLTDSNNVIMDVLVLPYFTVNKLVFWAALADTIYESKHDLTESTLVEVVFWPLKAEITHEALQVAQSEAVWYKWYTLYSIMPTRFDEQTRSLIKEDHPFSLCVTIALLKRKLGVKNTACHLEAIKLLNLIEKAQYKSLGKYLPILIDTLVLLVNMVVEKIDEDLARTAISIVVLVIKHMNQVLTSAQGQSIMEISLFEHLIKPIDKLIQVKNYSCLIPNLVNGLCDLATLSISHTAFHKAFFEILHRLASYFHVKSVTSEKIMNIIKSNYQSNESCQTKSSVGKLDKSITSETKEDQHNVEIMKEESEDPKNNKDELKYSETEKDETKASENHKAPIVSETTHEPKNVVVNKSTKNSVKKPAPFTSQNKQEKKNFTTPGTKSVKKINKKEPNIVNTVVENGEEFEVVKSNWKFNPKKLTENQKEKLKRKRDDIPALYQDLSQSQDEFKLSTWKSDSQDASTTTSSKSESNNNSNNDIPNILRNIPSTDVVPKIIENIFPQNLNKDTDKILEKSTEKSINKRVSPVSVVKDPKTPRMALKDRVFRNVRNLIEKSGSQSVSNLLLGVEDIIQQVTGNNEMKTPINTVRSVTNITENDDMKTPVDSVKSVTNMRNGSPSKITTERPCRTIKKPKKFEDTEIFALKKRKRLQGSLTRDSQPYCQTEGDAINKLESTIIDVPALPTNTNEINNLELSSKPPDISLKEISVDEVPVVSIPIDIATNKAPMSQIENSQVTKSIDQSKDKLNDQNEPEKNHVEHMTHEQDPNVEKDMCSQTIEEISTPKLINQRKDNKQSTIKKKRSRIEKQLLIDMVEGHPLLQQSQSEKRTTRKNINFESKDTVSKRRKSLIEKSHKIMAELESAGSIKKKAKESSKASKSKSEQNNSQEIIDSQPITVTESQETVSNTSDDMPMSEDVIESSQDSSITTISVKSSASKKKIPVVRLDIEKPLVKNTVFDTQNSLDNLGGNILMNNSTNESKEDIELSKNKTMINEKSQDLTESMDTEPMASSGEIIFMNDETPAPIVINTEDTCPGKETQELAEADTLPMDIENQSISPMADSDQINNTANDTTVKKSQIDHDITIQGNNTSTISMTAEAIADIIQESSNTGSPTRDEIQRKKEFLNDTLELSPIKTLSPIQESKTTSVETSSEYVVIKLTSPVQSNGEPFSDKSDSPEIFTEEKVSPDKCDMSPPRKEVTPNNSSPSSSLSLKKNRPQMRFNGRAAQMLELCVTNATRSDNDEAKKSVLCTPVKRNLKKAYTTDNSESQANDNSSEESENFLKFTRAVPTADSSPSGPILKRKLAEIADEATVSPASKRKRVSFHDPPVSTTVAVQKYLEPLAIRSPSNSSIKRQERQLRVPINAKSPKRLETVFRLDTVLTKAVESFSQDVTASNDTEMSLDETPAVEIVKTSELNDKDPICAELIDCKDPIENIAGELSSPSTKALLIKELEGKVETIADLAKMTELEVNRLCIKAPKVKVAKKVLSDYSVKRMKTQEINMVKTPTDNTHRHTQTETQILKKVVEKVNMQVQTNELVTKSSEMQTEMLTSLVQTQTDTVSMVDCSTQAKENTKDIVASCLIERPDFVNQLTKQLDETSVLQILEKLPFDLILSSLMKKMTPNDCQRVLNCVLSQSTVDSKDLVLLCIQLLEKIRDKQSIV